VADAYDNALAESFVSTLKRELLHRHSWTSRESVWEGIFEYIERFYNPRRRHSSLGHLSARSSTRRLDREVSPWLNVRLPVEAGQS
jgi:transposase InsO family protein